MDEVMTHSSDQFYTPSSKRRGSKKWLFLIILILLLISGYFIFASFGGKKKAKIAAPIPTPTQIPTENPTPTPTPSVSPTPTKKISPTSTQKIIPSPTSKTTSTSLTVEVLNGSGVAGAAIKMKTFLTNLGYTVSSTGNADKFTYTKTMIRVKSSKSSSATQLEKDLSSDYSVEIGSPLPASSAVDAQIIVGKQ